jgi:hypothetical protein
MKKNQGIPFGRIRLSGEHPLLSLLLFLTKYLSILSTSDLTKNSILCIPRHPTILKAFRALASYRAKTGDDGGVKITAFDTLDKPTTAKASASRGETIEEELCDLFIFPAGLRYNSLPVSLLEAVVINGIGGGIGGDGDVVLPAAAITAQETSGITAQKLYLFVCCHGSRDARCGVLGTALARELIQIIKERNLENLIEVYTTSHIGGHKYAGNVVLYGGSHPSDGDWYGGLHAEHAAVFLDAIVKMEIGVDGGAEDPMLREFWRGRMGLSKEEQIELWEAGGGVESGAESEGELEEEEEKI